MKNEQLTSMTLLDAGILCLNVFIEPRDDTTCYSINNNVIGTVEFVLAFKLVTLDVPDHNLMLPICQWLNLYSLVEVLEAIKLFCLNFNLIDHVSRVCYCASLRLFSHHQAHVTDIVALPAVI